MPRRSPGGPKKFCSRECRYRKDSPARNGVRTAIVVDRLVRGLSLEEIAAKEKRPVPFVAEVLSEHRIDPTAHLIHDYVPTRLLSLLELIDPNTTLQGGTVPTQATTRLP